MTHFAFSGSCKDGGTPSVIDVQLSINSAKLSSITQGTVGGVSPPRTRSHGLGGLPFVHTEPLCLIRGARGRCHRLGAVSTVAVDFGPFPGCSAGSLSLIVRVRGGGWRPPPRTQTCDLGGLPFVHGVAALPRVVLVPLGRPRRLPRRRA